MLKIIGVLASYASCGGGLTPCLGPLVIRLDVSFDISTPLLRCYEEDLHERNRCVCDWRCTCTAGAGLTSFQGPVFFLGRLMTFCRVCLISLPIVRVGSEQVYWEHLPTLIRDVFVSSLCFIGFLGANPKTGGVGWDTVWADAQFCTTRAEGVVQECPPSMVPPRGIVKRKIQGRSRVYWV